MLDIAFYGRGVQYLMHRHQVRESSRYSVHAGWSFFSLPFDTSGCAWTVNHVLFIILVSETAVLRNVSEYVSGRGNWSWSKVNLVVDIYEDTLKQLLHATVWLLLNCVQHQCQSLSCVNRKTTRLYAHCTSAYLWNRRSFIYITVCVKTRISAINISSCQSDI